MEYWRLYERLLGGVARGVLHANPAASHFRHAARAKRAHC